MTAQATALLTDRGVVSVTGPDAGKLLQGILTNDVDRLGQDPAIHAALLSPQGKILFDFVVFAVPGGFLLDVAADKTAELAKRLTMYRLRAKAAIADVSAGHGVVVAWGDGATPPPGAIAAAADPRLPALGLRAILPRDAAQRFDAAAAPRYHAHRIGLGVPEGGRDFVFGDTFPHEALLDQLGGVSFTKGCYVGQEIVSRMEHRGTARKRVVPVASSAPLPSPGPEVRALDPETGSQLIGTLGSVDGTRGLALLRLDRAAELAARGAGLTAGGVALAIGPLPAWASFTYPPKASAPG